ncbi:MAG: alpha/beta hydrolase-fold protein, partial [bacterium]
PVTSGLKLGLWLDGEGLESAVTDGKDGDAYLRVSFDFSWHPRGQHHVIFEGVSGAVGGFETAPATEGDTSVTWQFEVPRVRAGERNARVVLDLEAAVSLLPGGADNTLSGFSIEIGARNGRAVRLALDSLALWSERPEGRHQLATVQGLAELYGSGYGGWAGAQDSVLCAAGGGGPTQHVGLELGGVHTPQLPHMNAYLADAAKVCGVLAAADTLSREAWVDAVHAAGGLVSFNHPFGANRNPRTRGVRDAVGLGERSSAAADATDYDESDEDAPTTVSPRLLAARGPAVSEDGFWEVAEPLLAKRGLGADILEVGYLFRGTGSLADHLRLWDLALANGIRLVGNGTSDSHGGAWGPDMRPNCFGSWVWARSTAAGDLISGLKAGRVAFGDPFVWKGGLAFGVRSELGDALMGDTLRVGGASATGWIATDQPLAGCAVKLVQVALGQGRDVAKVERTLDAADAAGFKITVADSCFVRVEVYGADGTPLVFSNPVYLFPVASATGEGDVGRADKEVPVVTVAASETILALAEAAAKASPGERSKLIDDFIAENAGGFPIVEDSLVTFVYRGEVTGGVYVPSDLNGWDTQAHRLERLHGTDLHHLTLKLPVDARIDYKFYVDGAWMLDPLNSKTVRGGFGDNSAFSMPAYVEPWELEALPGSSTLAPPGDGGHRTAEARADSVPRGHVDQEAFTSKFFGSSRIIRTYVPAVMRNVIDPTTPAGTDAKVLSEDKRKFDKYRVILVQDGGEYASLGAMTLVLDRLIARGAIPPVVAVFIDPVDRNTEYRLSPDYERMIVEEIIPKIRRGYPAANDPAKTAIMGASLGGLASAAIALNHPDIFGKCGSQSGAFAVDNGWLIERAEGRPAYPVDFYLDCGTFESLLDSNRKMRDVLIRSGHRVRYQELNEGHSWGSWRAHLDDMLVFFWGQD